MDARFSPEPRLTQGLPLGRVLLAHAVHLGVLLLPTWLCGGPFARGWAIGCFAVGITVAGVLECLLAAPEVPVRDPALQDRVALRVAQGVGIGLLALFWLAQIEWLGHGRDHGMVAIQATGGLLLAGGVLLRIGAIRALGPQFVSDIRVGKASVRGGIYAWFRHPSEIGLLLMATGAPLLLGALYTALVAACLLVPISLWRMHREDAAWDVPRARGSDFAGP